ncbi:hypothetical protein CTH30272_03063 [Allocatenococcus thiocycli]|nr:hypothetical protein CTH30272_03063 [Catenococcus thiocycli]
MKTKQEEKLQLLIKLTRISKPEIVEALRLYFIEGLSQRQSRIKAGASYDSAVAKAIKSVESAMSTVDELAKYKNVKFSNNKSS